MRLPLILPLITAALAFISAPAFSASADGGKHCGAHRQKVLEKFDANKDGKLDESERATAKAACQTRQAEREAKLKEKHPQLFAKIDKDGDGHLSKDERKAARAEHKCHKGDKHDK